MSEKVIISPEKLKKIRTVDEKLVSYNIEMTEVTGGTFWKRYTKGQIEGTEEFPLIKDLSEAENMLQPYPAIDLYEPKIRKFASALGQCYVRVSGSWATDTYYDFDGHTGGKIPEGYRAILTKEQWTGVLDFVKAVNAKLLISVSNCLGDHVDGKPWTPEQAKLIFDYSKEYGVPIDAAEFMNEPNGVTIALPNYTLEDYARDQDAFYRFIRENYPEVTLVGPCGVGEMLNIGKTENIEFTMATTDELLSYCKEKGDIFSYHFYNGISERAASMGGHWPAEKATTEEYLKVVENNVNFYGAVRDKYYEGSPMWVTESGDAGGGGNTWASTTLDTLRTVNELGRFAQMTDGIIFHNTLASSDYGYLDRETHMPRPNYWAVYLWNQLMGTTVYETGEEIREGAHVYVHSRRDGKDGYAYAIINNSTTESTVVELPSAAEVYTLNGETLRAAEVMLNGTVLKAGEDGSIPEITSVKAENSVELPPASVTYIVL